MNVLKVLLSFLVSLAVLVGILFGVDANDAGIIGLSTLFLTAFIVLFTLFLLIIRLFELGNGPTSVIVAVTMGLATSLLAFKKTLNFSTGDILLLILLGFTFLFYWTKLRQ